MNTDMHMNPKHSLPLLVVVVLAATAASAADEHGHDHGAPAAAVGSALPRFTAVSEAFELVGVVDGKQLTVYLDRFEDNAPVKDAQIDLEIGGAKVAVKQVSDGEYAGSLPQELKPGIAAVTATIVAGDDTDILAADLLLQEPRFAQAGASMGWRRYAVWGAVAAVVVAVLVGIGRRAGAARRVRVGGAA
jgi:hypothetical protein